MDNLSKLAALQQLRASGALSDEEFEAQKRTLLQPGKVWWPVGLPILLGIALLAAFLALRQPADAPSVASGDEPTAAADTAETNGPNVTSPSSQLANFIKPDILGARLAYWEGLAGPARERFGQTLGYTVAGCDVEIDLDTGGNVFAVGFKPSEACNVDLSPFFSTPLGMARALKISGLRERGASFRSDCISACGNAADPVVQAVSGGSRSDEYRTLIADIVLDNDAASAASTKWKRAMKQAGKTEDYIQNTEFNCDTTFDKEAMSAFGPLSVSRIKITNGYPMENSDGCGSGDG